MGVFARGNMLWISYKDAAGRWRNATTGHRVGEEAEAQRKYEAVKGLVEERKTDGITMATLRITEETIATLATPTDRPQAYYWDTILTGFGVVVGKTGRKTFVARVRDPQGKMRKHSIGIYQSPWTVDDARDKAQSVLAEIASGKREPKADGKGRPSWGPTSVRVVAIYPDGTERVVIKTSLGCRDEFQDASAVLDNEHWGVLLHRSRVTDGDTDQENEDSTPNNPPRRITPEEIGKRYDMTTRAAGDMIRRMETDGVVRKIGKFLFGRLADCDAWICGESANSTDRSSGAVF